MEFSDSNCREFMEQLPEAVFLETLEGDILDVNKEACKLLDYSKKELTKMEVGDLVPEDAPAFFLGEIDDATRTGEPLETVNMQKDGTEVPVALRGRIIEVEGAKRMLVTVRDIKERVKARNELEEANQKLKQSKERYQSYFEELGDAVFITKVGGEEHGQILEANRTTEEQTGYSREELIGMNIEDDIAVEPLETIDYKKGNEKIEQGETVTFTEEKRRKDGTKYWTEVLITPIEYKGENASLSINRDVTERKEAEQALNEERDKLKTLHDAVDLLQQQESEEDVLNTSVGVAENILGFEICGIMLLRGDRLVSEALSPGVEFKEPTSFPKDEGVAGKTFRKRKTVWLEDVRDFEDAKSPADGFRAIISAPIGEIGVLQILSEEVAAFTEQDVELAEILAGHLREELERVRLEEELRQKAIKDPLTGLYNRRYFNQTLSKEVGRSERYNHNIALLMVDINRFKEVNDRYSHQTGDDVLKGVGRLLRQNVRQADTVVRYGGDEFLIMLPETNGDSRYIVNRLRGELEQWNKNSDLIDFDITLAIGASHWNPDQKRTLEEALKEADKKMYKNKNN